MKLTLIDNLEFAQKEEKHKGKLKITQFERLLDVLSPVPQKQNTVYYELQGHRDKFYLPSLNLTIIVTLSTICQHCLASMPLELSLAYDYVLSDIEPEDDSDQVDWLQISKEMGLVKLIEDELIMAMPISSLHDHQCTQQTFESDKKENIFATLKGRIN